GFKFQVRTFETDESFPEDLDSVKVAAFIARKKAAAYKPHLAGDELVIVADTVVILDNTALGKPSDKEEAKEMLRALSGQKHLVMTGVGLCSLKKEGFYEDSTFVYFKSLTEQEIEYYVDKYQPFDKAGAYGAQEWMGMVGVEKIEGSYFNVMGLPLHR